MPFGGPDRRLRTRFRVKLPFLLKGAEKEVEGITRNVSLLGVSSYTKGPLPQGQPVQCILELPSESEPVTANGTIIHCEAMTHPSAEGTHEVGIFFKEFEDAGESTLACCLEQISKKEESALRVGYQVLKQKVAARKRRKRLEALRKRRRRLARLRRKRQRLAQERRGKERRRAKGSKSRAARRSVKSPKSHS